MIFRSKYRNLRYVIDPSFHKLNAHGLKGELVKGLSADFVGQKDGTFDSVKAAAQNRWDDTTREAVEEYLLNHQDCGVWFYHVPEPEEQVVLQACIGKLLVPGESEARVCGRPVEPGEDYCVEHLPARVTA